MGEACIEHLAHDAAGLLPAHVLSCGGRAEAAGPPRDGSRDVSVTPTDERREAYHRETRAPSVLDDQHLLNEPEVVERSRRPGPIQRIRNVWQYRELLRQPRPQGAEGQVQEQRPRVRLVAAEPAAVPGRLLRRVPDRSSAAAIPYFPIFLLSGLLVWNLFSAGLGGGDRLDRRQRRPRAARCRSPARSCRWPSVGAALVHFFLQTLVLLGGAGRVPVRRRPGRTCPLLHPGAARAAAARAARSASCSRRSTSTSATRSTCSSSRCSRGSG